ncbi:MAG: virulence RhuM family protein [Bacteroidales bacterium]|nr:virulence RhuM family protein [Bacteroidales bacterium]
MSENIDNSVDNIVMYHTEDVQIEVRVADDTVWLTQSQMAVLFGVKENTITYHIKEIYKIQELDALSTTRKIRVVRKEGIRLINRNIDFYNLDMILSVGYRINTVSGIQFRRWATLVLKEYMLGYVQSPPMLKVEHRLLQHDQQILALNQRVDKLVQTALPPKYGLFFNGQTFDAFVFVSDLIKSAESDIKIVDNYLDERILMMLSKRKEGVSATIYAERVTPSFYLDVETHNSQYSPVAVRTIFKVHDRFLLIDHQRLYHFGASFKDLGKKLFMVARIEDPAMVSAIRQLLG